MYTGEWTIADFDPDLAAAINDELRRQEENIERLIKLLLRNGQWRTQRQHTTASHFVTQTVAERMIKHRICFIACGCIVQ